MFRNAYILRVTPGFRFDEILMLRRLFMPCGKMDRSSSGFVPPVPGSDSLVHHFGAEQHQLICLQTEDRLLPASVVSEQVADEIERIEVEQGFKVGARQRRDIKERVVSQLLPRTLSIKRRTRAVLAGGYLIIDTSSNARADDMLRAIMDVVGSVPFSMLRTVHSPVVCLTSWMVSGEPPEMLTIDRDAQLELPAETKSVIKYARADMDSAGAIDRLKSGYYPSRVAMTYNDRVSFVLKTASMQLLRLCFLDILREEEELKNAESSEELFDAELILFTGELVRLIGYLVESLGGAPDAEADLLEAA